MRVSLCCLSVLLCVAMLMSPCTAVLSKLFIGTCCNGDASFPAQEKWTGRPLYIVGAYAEFCQSSFYDWAFGSVILPEWNAGRVTHLTLSAQTSDGCSPNNYVPPDPNAYILSGAYDTYIAAFVSHLTSFLAGPDGKLNTADDRRIYLRLMHELNGNWYSWSANSTSYALMWRYVWNKVMVGTSFTKSHIQWVFEPISPWEVDAAHDFRLYWPGDQYVDWLSLDAYNSAGQQSWYQPGEIFDSILFKLRDWRPYLPVMISETGSYSNSGSNIAQKAQWITDLYNYLAGQNVQIVLYFNTDNGGDWPYFGDEQGQETITGSDGNKYNVFDTFKSSTLALGYTPSVKNNTRILTDAEFQGRLPGFSTPPAAIKPLVIYNNGANYYDWQCTPAPYQVNLKDSTQHRSGETYSMSLTLSAWGNVQFHSSHLGANTSNYYAFQFNIYTTQSNVQLNVQAFTSKGNFGSYPATIPTANTWTQITYNFTKLGVPVGTMVQGVYVQGASNNNQGVAYFAGVQLLANPVNWPKTGWPSS